MPLRFSAIDVTGDPEKEPVTLAQAKAQLRILHSDEDSYISTLIPAARGWAEDFTRRAFITTTLDVMYKEWPRWLTNDESRIDRTFIVPRPPLQTVESLTYIDSAGDTITVDAGQYNIECDRVRMIQTFGKPCLNRDRNFPITISCTVGYGNDPDDVPARIKQAILIMITHLYENRAKIVVDQRLVLIAIPSSAESLLNPYKLRLV